MKLDISIRLILQLIIIICHHMKKNIIKRKKEIQTKNIIKRKKEIKKNMKRLDQNLYINKNDT